MQVNVTQPSASSRHTGAAPTAPATYRPDIDGLRAVAVSAVVLFHAFPGVLPGGFVGVDIFFVISGFLIGGILIDAHVSTTFSYRDFYVRRVRRLFPALTVVLAAVLLAGYFLQAPSEFRVLGKHVVAGAGFASNLVLLRESGYFDTASALKPLLHLWSLGIEEQFYILCPLLLAMAWRLRMPVLWLIAGVGVMSFAVGIFWQDAEPAKAFFHPASRFWELFAGVALAALVREQPRLLVMPARGREFFAGASLLLLASSLALLDEDRDFPGYIALAPVVGAVLVILLGAQSVLLRPLLANRLLVFIGLISYPLYLWHWPLLSFARVYFHGEPTLWWRLGLMALAVLLAWLTWRWLEKPLRHARGRFPVTAALVVAMLVLLAMGVAVQKTDGAAWRYPAPLRAIAAFDFNGKEASRAGTCFVKSEQTHRDYVPECL